MKTQLVNENFKQDYLANLLKARGVTDIKEFLEPTSASLEDWRNLDNIQIGVGLLNTQLRENKNVLLIVDPDVDGFTSSAIMYQYIKKIYPDAHVDYMLHEHKEHGLSDLCQKIIDSDTHYGLVILPDSSSNDYQYHEQLAEIGTNCLVIDHHEIDDNQKISSNAIIINNQLSDRYTNKALTGAGMAYQFCRAFDELLGYNYADDFIDLAALGICGDMGSVLNLENRYIMYTGFQKIKNTFFEEAVNKQSYSMGGEINAISVAFYIVPMINAMIRVGSQPEKERLFEAMIDGDKFIESNKRGAKGEMERAAIESLRECTNAKAKQTRITDQMVEKLEFKVMKNDLLQNKVLLVRLDEDDEFPAEINGSNWPSNTFSVYQRGI